MMSPHSPKLSPDTWHSRTNAALAWTRRSIAATQGQGSAHSYSPIWGWARAYPETTGYLIETLLRYAKLTADDTLRQLAFQCGDWLCSVQLPSGAFSGGTAGGTRPSVFNTAQILFGLLKLDAEILSEENAIQINPVSPYRTALKLALGWLMENLGQDGAWRTAAYVRGFVPSYYTRAVWGALVAAQHLRQNALLEQLRRALSFYSLRIRSDGTVADWGLRPGPWAFTHTLAYTYEGFWESALLLQDTVVQEQILQIGTAFLAQRDKAGRTAGRYGAQWAADLSFQCPTGTAQLSVWYFRLWEHTGSARFRQASYELLTEALEAQWMKAGPNRYGALPGSTPLWGPYLRWRYPNWGVKFLLDALANWAPDRQVPGISS